MTKHGFAFLPDDGRPDRLIRFVSSDVPDGVQHLAIYVQDRNILYLNKRLFDALDSVDQGRALTTHTDLYAAVRDGRVSIAD
jgi:hypothetical protein